MCAVDQKRPFFPRPGRFWTFCPLRDLSPLQGPLRDRLTGRPLTGRLLTGRLGPYRKPLTRRDGPYGKGRGPVRVLHREGRRRGLREGPLRGGFLREGPLRITGKLTGSYGERLYQNWAGISRLFAVHQERPFFPRAGPFLDLLPFKGPFSLTGALTGPPYGKAPYGEASYGKAGQTALRKAPYEEASYEKVPYELRKLTGSYGEGFYQNWAGISACVP